MVKHSKAQLRRELLVARRNMSAGDAEMYSRTIVESSIQLIPWASIKTLHVYMPLEQYKEVNTWPLLHYVWQHAKASQLVVPVMRGGSMRAMTAPVNTPWHTGPMGLHEPVEGELLLLDRQCDVIIVPMLGFNNAGYRIGYGGGHYDKFLATQQHALMIGLCYEDGLVSFSPEPHDVPLEYIVTEQKIYSRD